MDVTFFGSLLALALIDSTSFGTLLIPIWLLLHPGSARPARMLVFLGTVAGFYLGLGLGLAAGATAVWPHVRAALDTDTAAWVQLGIGVALFGGSFLLEGQRKRSGRGAGRLDRWRDRALTGDQGIGSLVGLALAATAIEVGTMLPYLAAIGLIAAAGLTTPATVLVLTGYCLVMVAPALVLLAVRMVTGRRLEPLLGRIGEWMTRSDALAWVVGILGFLLARDAINRLGLLRWGG